MRGRAVKWAWLTASALCTALLFACAGENAVQTFRAQQRTEEAAGVEESGQLSGYVIALDAGHGGYDGGAVGRVSGTADLEALGEDMNVTLPTGDDYDTLGGLVFSRDGDMIWQCGNCGHIVVGKKAPEVCPVCKHPQAYFQIKAQNY